MRQQNGARPFATQAPSHELPHGVLADITYTIILVGRTGNGKSATANTVAGKVLFEAKKSMVSVTDVPKKEVVVRNGIELRIVDTVGLGDTCRSAEIVNRLTSQAVAMSPEGFDAILVVVKFDRFTREEADLQTYLERYVLGPEGMKKVVVVVTHADHDETPPEGWIGKLRADAQRLPDLKRLLDAVDWRVAFLDNKNRNDEAQLNLLLSRIEEAARAGGRYTWSMLDVQQDKLRKAKEAEEAALRAQEEKRRNEEKEREDLRKRNAELQQQAKLQEEMAARYAELEKQHGAAAEALRAQMQAQMEDQKRLMELVMKQIETNRQEAQERRKKDEEILAMMAQQIEASRKAAQEAAAAAAAAAERDDSGWCTIM